MRKLICVLTFLGIILFSSCEKDDEIATDSISTSIYNKDISNYLNLLKTESNKENSLKIEALVDAIDLNSVKIYTLKTTEKLLVVDLKSLKGFETSDKTKAIFFVYENKITHSNIVTFNVKVPFDNLDKVMLSVLDMKKNKDNYTGKISFYNMYQNISLSNEFENGKLTFNGIARRKITKSIIGKSAGCIDWYWVTNSSYEYLYTTCDPCEAYRTSGIKCGGGGGGGSSSGTSGPAYPSNPKNNDLYTYIDQDGEVVTKKYNGVTGVWDLFSISLSDVITYSKPAKYYYLIIQWPYDQQKVIHGDLIYNYDGASGNWEGVPATDELIAEAIEDQIDDSQLDECTKGVLAKLKNLNQSDIAEMISRFSAPGSIFNINMVTGQVSNQNNLAETKPVSGSNFDINMVFNENYIKGVGNPSPPTDLSVATTMAHEIIHAYLISLLGENKACGASGICDFPTIYDAYVAYQITKDPNVSPDAHHELIANNYVYSIAATIQEFHTGQSVDSGFPSQVYLDMAWGGLDRTYIFNKNYPNDPNHKNYKDRERIFSRINTEKIGSQYGIYSPVGTPCKK